MNKKSVKISTVLTPPLRLLDVIAVRVVGVVVVVARLVRVGRRVAVLFIAVVVVCQT